MEKKSRVGWALLLPFLLFRSTQVDRKPHRLLGAAAQAGLERPWHPAKLAAKEQHPLDPSSQLPSCSKFRAGCVSLQQPLSHRVSVLRLTDPEA